MSVQTIYYSSKPNSTSIPLKQNINNGLTRVKNGLPAKFEGADGGTSFAIGRTQYINTKQESNQTLKELYKIKQPSCSYITGRRINSSCVRGGKPFNIDSADQHIQKLKNRAIGRGSMPSTPDKDNNIDLSFKSSTASNLNTTKAALRRCRNGGCVAPAKKGAQKK